MSTVAAKELAQYPWFIRLFFWKQQRTYGRVLDPGLLWGRSPWVFAAVALLYGALGPPPRPCRRRCGRWSRCGSRRSTIAPFASTSTRRRCRSAASRRKIETLARLARQLAVHAEERLALE